MAILRATQLEETLQSEKLRELVTRCSSLPSVPEIYSELIEELQNPDADNEDMARIVLKDGGMTARILKLANSAFFGFGQEISDISQAIIYLGTETIKSLILFSNAFSEHEQLKFPGFAVESLWQHSLEAACASKRIAIHEDEERKVTEEAYVAGLLHDVGKLMLAANLPAQYQEAIAVARREKVPLSVVERKMFGADHADIGGYLLGLWGLPVPVVEAIALHHRPGTVVQKKFSPLTAVHVGNILVTPKTPAIPNLPASELDENYLAEAGLRGRVKVWQKEWLEQTV
jgi:HD-like signal output (HDOD) protein